MKCVVQSPVGARCKECAQVRTLPIYQAGPFTVAKAAVIGLVVATLGFTFLFLAVRGFAFWLSPLVGIAVGEAISLASNRKRAFALQVTAAAAVAIGILLADVLLLFLRFGRFSTALAVQAVVADLFMLSIITLLAIVLAVSRLR